MTIIVAGTITFDPAKTEQFVAAAAAVMEGTRQEEGNLAYVIALDPLEPGTVNVYERWVDEAALAVHAQAPYFQAFGAAMGDLGVTGAEVLKYQIASEGPLF